MNSRLEIVNQHQMICTLWLPYDMVSAFIGTCLSVCPGHNSFIQHWLQIRYYSLFRFASSLVTSRVSRLQNFSSERCHRNSSTDFACRYLTHTIWKRCQKDYCYGSKLFHHESTHQQLTYESPSHLDSLYRWISKVYWRQDIIGPWKRPEWSYRKRIGMYCRWPQLTNYRYIK